MLQAVLCLIPAVIALPYHSPTYQYFINRDYAVLIYHPASEMVWTEIDGTNNWVWIDSKGYAYKAGSAEANRWFSDSFDVQVINHFTLLIFFSEHWLKPWDMRDFALLSRYWQRGGKWSLETIANLLHDNWL